MNILLLKGEKDSYIFSPDNPGTILRKNGKFGNVHIGARASDKKKVIIKILDGRLAEDALAVDRFRNEASIQIDHPSLAQGMEFVLESGDFFLIREYIPGTDLKTVLREKPFGKKTGLRFFVRCAMAALEGLETLHAHHLVHRDIKPANLIFVHEDIEKNPPIENPEVKLIDFGLTTYAGQTSSIVERIPFSLIYSPPEQVLKRHALVNATSDLYSLAVSLYEMITGLPPYVTGNPELMMNLQLTGEMNPNEKIPDGLFAILKKAAAKYKLPKPPNFYTVPELEEMLSEGQKLRYASASEFKSALNEFLSGYRDEDRGGLFGWWKKNN